MGDLEPGCPAPAVSPAAEPPYNAGCQRKSPGRLEDSFMSRSRCRYCDQDNPADSKFCSSCGGALHLPPHLVSCPRCGTVNPIKATVCCWCKDQLPGRRSLPRPRSPVDRKSTRLNSSHSQISYAVFCLKKKKKKEYTINFPTNNKTAKLL